MFKHLIAVAASAVIATSTMSLSGAVSAAEERTEPARLVVYRADELIKSRSLSLTLKLDGAQIARLHSDDAVIAGIPAGRSSWAANQSTTRLSR